MNKRQLLLATLALAAGSALAQDAYPNKPIRFVVPYPPGGPTDLMARLLQPEMQQRLGVPIVIENKGGAGGNVGTADVAKQAPADGYTMLLAASGPMAVNQSLFKTLNYSPLTDLVPVIQLSSFPLVLEVHPSLGIKTIKEFIAQTKAKPDELTYASAGNGTPQHLAGEIYNKAVGGKLAHIPYRGAGPALQDLIAGQVDLMFDGLGSSAVHIKNGRIKALAVAATKRAPGFPDVPTSVEAGVPSYQVATWYGLWAPKGTPKEVIASMQAELKKAFATDEIKASWNGLGTEVPAVYGDAFGQFVHSEVKRWAEVVKSSGAKLD